MRSSTEVRLVCERRVEQSGSPDTSTSSQRCLAGAEDTDIDGGKGALLQSKAAHVQPFLTAFTLDHGLALICAVADTTCAVVGEDAPVCRRRGETFGARRAIEAIGEWVITTVPMRRGGATQVGSGLRPALTVCLQSVL